MKKYNKKKEMQQSIENSILCNTQQSTQNSNTQQNFELFNLKINKKINFYIQYFLNDLKTFSKNIQYKSLQFSLDDTFKFYFLENIEKENYFFQNLVIEYKILNESMKKDDDEKILLENKLLENDTEHTIYSTLQSLPTIQKNLLLGHLNTHIKNKNVLLHYKKLILKEFNIFFETIFFYCKTILKSYQINKEKRKNIFKSLIKKKLETILNTEYNVFLQTVKKFFEDIKQIEINLNIKEHKQFSKSLDTCLLQASHYLHYLNSKCHKNIKDIENKNKLETHNTENENSDNKENINPINFIEKGDTSFQMHEILKFKDSKSFLHSKNISENLLLFEQIEEDLKNVLHKDNVLLQDNTYDLHTKGLNTKILDSNIEKNVLKTTLLYTNNNDALKNVLQINLDIQEDYIRLKHAMSENAQKNFDEYQALDIIDKKETVKSILNEISPCIKQLFDKLHEYFKEGIKKLKVLENLLKTTTKELDEQKKINKNNNVIKIDLCIKYFFSSTFQKIKEEENDFFTMLEADFCNHLENFFQLSKM